MIGLEQYVKEAIGRMLRERVDKDKYYTPNVDANKLIDLTFKVIKTRCGWTGKLNVLEPAAGGGAFSDNTKLSDNPDLVSSFRAFDLYPDSETMRRRDASKYYSISQTFGKESAGSKSLAIGNPPFDNKSGQLSRIFLALKDYDFIAFILPAQYYQSTPDELSSNGFSMIYSMPMSADLFGRHRVRCCFNIYSKTGEAMIPNYKIGPSRESFNGGVVSVLYLNKKGDDDTYASLVRDYGTPIECNTYRHSSVNRNKLLFIHSDDKNLDDAIKRFIVKEIGESGYYRKFTPTDAREMHMSTLFAILRDNFPGVTFKRVMMRGKQQLEEGISVDDITLDYGAVEPQTDNTYQTR